MNEIEKSFISEWIKNFREPDVNNDEETYSFTEETFTVTEIREALIRLGFKLNDVRDLVEEIKAHREPEWLDGDVVLDSAGCVWVRDWREGWLKAGTAGRYSDGSLKRPLTQLVPKEK